jgi:hypothetical protein
MLKGMPLLSRFDGEGVTQRLWLAQARGYTGLSEDMGSESKLSNTDGPQ